jgi:hypothetical protein
MKLKSVFIAIVFLLVAPFATTASHAEDTMFGKISDDELLSLFLIRAVKATDTGGSEETATATIVKWDRPPRVRVVSEDKELASYFAENVVRPFLRTFTASTNFTATVSQDDNYANILTIIGDNPAADLETYSAELLQIMKQDQSQLDELKVWIQKNRGNCFFKPRVVDRTIVSAVIYVPTPGTAMFASAKCFGVSAARTFGLLGPDDESDTVKNRTDPSVSLTASDQAALRILYDPRVPSMIKIGELATIVGAINRELGSAE